MSGASEQPIPSGKDEDFSAYYNARPTEPSLEKVIAVQVVGRRCVYVNDYRVAGGKPYYSENLPNQRFNTTVRQALDAFTDSDLKAALRERKARKNYFAVWHAALAKAREGGGQ